MPAGFSLTKEKVMKTMDLTILWFSMDPKVVKISAGEGQNEKDETEIMGSLMVTKMKCG